MRSLHSLYLSRRDLLAQRLANAVNPKEYLNTLDAFLMDLTDLKGEYIQGLTPTEVRFSLAVVNSIRAIFRSVAAVMPEAIKVIDEQQDASSDRLRENSRFPTLSAITGVGTAGIIGGAVSFVPVAIPAAIITGLLASAAAQSLIAAQARSATGTHERPCSVPSAVVAEPFKYSENFLEGIFRTVDELVAECGRLEQASRPKVVPPKIEDHPGVLSLFQELLGWYGRKQADLQDDSFYPLRLRIEESLPDLLARYDLEVRAYNEDYPDDPAFESEEDVGSQDLKKPRTINPAFVRGDKVICKGRVVLPKSN